MFSIGFIIIAVIIVVALLILFSFVPVGLWISALAAGVHVGIGTLGDAFKTGFTKKSYRTSDQSA